MKLDHCPISGAKDHTKNNNDKKINDTKKQMGQTLQVKAPITYNKAKDRLEKKTAKHESDSCTNSTVSFLH